MNAALKIEEPIRHTVRLKVVRPVFEKLTIKDEEAKSYGLSTIVTESATVYHLFKHLADEAKEHFLCLHMDNKNKILAVDIVSTGSLTASIVHPREIFKSALLTSAASIIMVHNHPSGDPKPSREDIEITGRIRKAGELLGIRVLDHIVIGDGDYVSFADQGFMDATI